MHRNLPFLVVCLLAGQPAAAQETPARTFQMDPVELVKRGKEVLGEDSRALTRNGYTYLFASAENKAAFEKAPDRYEIQLGGACARMGPLSGEGRCDLFAVHEGKLYIFASPQCREGFLKAPDKLLETDDAPVGADEDARKRGRELFDLAVKAHGGAAAIDAAKTYRRRIDAQTEYQGKSVRTGSLLFMAFPDRCREESYWGEKMWAHSIATDQGAFWTEKGFDRAMAPAQVRAARRLLNHHLLTILKARIRPDFIVAWTGETTMDGNKVQQVDVSFDGTTCRLGIDPASGRVRTLAFRSRGGDRSTLGRIEQTFTDWQSIEGVLLPTGWASSFDGQPAPGKPTRLSKTEINPRLDPALFVGSEAKQTRGGE